MAETAEFGPVDVSLTAISGRMATLPRTLGSLLAQDYPDITIHLYLSEEPYLLDAGVGELPGPVADCIAAAEGRIVLHRVPNWGPYRKLLPYLHEHWGMSRLVATADDDTIYPSDWLSGLLAAYGTYGCVVGYRGHQFRFEPDGRPVPYRRAMKSRVEENPGRLILPTGKDGVLYNTAFFPEGVLDVTRALEIAPTVDDLWFRWHLALNRVPACLVNVDYATATFEETDYEQSLYLNFNLSGGNDAAVAALEAHFAATYGTTVAALTAPFRAGA